MSNGVRDGERQWSPAERDRGRSGGDQVLSPAGLSPTARRTQRGRQPGTRQARALPYWWVATAICDPPHAVGRPEQVEVLAHALRDGWGSGYPALVGYVYGDRVQLLSGSHRFAAAIRAGRWSVPVAIRPWHVVEAAWGDLDRWAEVMAAPTVREC